MIRPSVGRRRCGVIRVTRDKWIRSPRQRFSHSKSTEESRLGSRLQTRGLPHKLVPLCGAAFDQLGNVALEQKALADQIARGGRDLLEKRGASRIALFN